MRALTLWQAVAIALELGAALAVAVFIGLLAGKIADDQMGNTTPIFTVVGSLVGLAAGVYSTTRLALFLTSSGRR